MYNDPNVPRIKDFNKSYLKKINKSISKLGPPPAILEFDLHGSSSRRCAFCPRVDEKIWPNIDVQFFKSYFKK